MLGGFEEHRGGPPVAARIGFQEMPGDVSVTSPPSTANTWAAWRVHLGPMRRLDLG